MIEYDRAQLELLRAIGNPPDEVMAESVESRNSVESVPTPPEMLDAPAGQNDPVLSN